MFQVVDGYSFRNTIGIIKSETDHATMVLSLDKIEISFLNRSKCAVHRAVLDPVGFSIYQYNIKDQSGALVDEYPIAFDTNEMYNTTKGIGRRDGIRLYWLPGDGKINIQPIKSSNKDPGKASALFVNILNLEYTRYDTGIYSQTPNIRVQAKDFAELCNQATTLKCSYVEIVGQQNGVVFKGILPNHTMASINKFTSQIALPKSSSSMQGDLDNLIGNLTLKDLSSTSRVNLNIVKSEDLMTVKVPITTIKALSKIHNISPSGTLLRFYFTEGKPTKIESPIGTYGMYTICLRDHKM